jgi:hypothetical protein
VNLYFVKADRGIGVEFAGHWLADSPKDAIEIGKKEMDTNPHSMLRSKNYSWSARKSNAAPAAMALNYPKGVSK